MFGIDFEGHPALVNLYLPEDFEGNPLRKSFKLATRVVKYLAGGEGSRRSGGWPLMSLTQKDLKTPQEVIDELSSGSLQTEQMLLNVGPQHPATHGVFRLLATIDGEVLVDAEPVIGYMHRGYEKLVEARDYRQITNLVSRMDWLSNIQNELPMWMAVEALMELEVPPRAQYMRVLMVEANRILNHLMFFASFGAELGAITPTFYAFREREDIQFAMEQATGGRMHFGYMRAGGLKEDVPRGFLDLMLKAVRQVIARMDDYYNLLVGNEIFKARTIGVGVLEPEVAYNYGVSGPIARGSDINFDVRKDEPYLVYDQFDFEVPVGTERGLLRSLLGPAARGLRERSDHRAGDRGHAVRPDPRQGSACDPTAGGRGLHPYRELARRVGLLPDLRRTQQAVPDEDQHAVVQQRFGSSLRAQGHVRVGHDRDPGVLLLRTGGHRPVIEINSHGLATPVRQARGHPHGGPGR